MTGSPNLVSAFYGQCAKRGIVALFAIVAIAYADAPAAAQQAASAQNQPEGRRLLAQGNIRVRIRDLDDIQMGSWNGLTDIVGSDAVCVFSTTQVYTVTAVGDGPNGQFALASTGGASVPYNVEWTDDNGRTEVLGAGAGSGPMSARTNSAACRGGTNATVTVRVSSTSAARGLAGLLSGTLMLEISPSN